MNWLHHLQYLFSHRRSRPILSVVMALLIPAIASGPAWADQRAAPRDYLQPTAGSQYIFAMLPDDSSTRRDPDIRKQYPGSGLYLKGQTGKPLWTVDWYAVQVFPCSDGRHLARMGPWASSPTELAVAFYDQGKLLKEYRIDELVTDPLSLPHSVSHFEWHKNITFNDAQKQLRILTFLGEDYTFDITTGNIVQGKFVPFVPKNRAQAMLHNGDMPGLIKLGKEAVPDLIEAARSGSETKQTQAIYVLCGLGVEAIPAFSQLAHDNLPQGRTVAAVGFNYISSPNARETLTYLLGDKDPGVRAQAIAALFQIHEDQKAASAARPMMEHGSTEEQALLLDALNELHPANLIPTVLDRLIPRPPNSPDGWTDPTVKRRTAADVTRLTEQWLQEATFQDFNYLGEGSPGDVRRFIAWRSWWAESKARTRDGWFASAVVQDVALLRSKDSQVRNWAVNRIHNLTGVGLQGVGDSGEPDARVWEKWWTLHKTQTPERILSQSIANSRNEFVHTILIITLCAIAERRDVPMLLQLYLAAAADKQSNGTGLEEKSHIEAALRRITNVDSFGCDEAGGDREKNAIRGWKGFIAANASG